MTTLVQIRNLKKNFGNTTVLKGIDLDIHEGRVTCVIGPSGSGKTTLLRCINHLEIPDAGDVIVDGQHIGYAPEGSNLRHMRPSQIARQRRDIGFVFQRFNLFPHMTVLDNIIEGPVRVKGENRDTAAARARKLLAQVGLADRADGYPSRLSGGQMQRVAIARALAMQPKLILFDEPTSALDPELVGEVLQAMRELATTGITMIVVTHEISFARELADTVVFMADGEAVEVGPAAEVLTNPRHKRTRDFLLRVNTPTGAAGSAAS